MNLPLCNYLYQKSKGQQQLTCRAFERELTGLVGSIGAAEGKGGRQIGSVAGIESIASGMSIYPEWLASQHTPTFSTTRLVQNILEQRLVTLKYPHWCSHKFIRYSYTEAKYISGAYRGATVMAKKANPGKPQPPTGNGRISCKQKIALGIGELSREHFYHQKKMLNRKNEDTCGCRGSRQRPKTPRMCICRRALSVQDRILEVGESGEVSPLPPQSTQILCAFYKISNIKTRKQEDSPVPAWSRRSPGSVPSFPEAVLCAGQGPEAGVRGSWTPLLQLQSLQPVWH